MKKIIIACLLFLLWEMYKRQREQARYNVLLNSVRRIPISNNSQTTGTGETDTATLQLLQQLQGQVTLLNNKIEDFEEQNFGLT